MVQVAKYICKLSAGMDVSIPHVNPYSSSLAVKRRFTGMQLTIGGAVLLCAAYIFFNRHKQRQQATAAITTASTTSAAPNATLGQLPAAISTNT